jgi:hypothetical protein
MPECLAGAAVQIVPVSRDFPAIREFNREFCNSEAFGDAIGIRNRCAAATYRAIPYSS